MKKALLALIALFGFSSSIFAQGSLYSVYGIGEIIQLPNSQSGGMGYVSTAILNPLYINRANPAALSAISTTRIVGDLSFSGFSASAGLGNSFQTSTVYNGVGIAVPIWKTVFSTGLYPYSRSDYNQRQSDLLEVPETDTTNILNIYRGIGGLNSVPLSVGFTPYNNRLRGTLRLGLSYNFIFGTLERRRETTLGNALTPQITSTLEERASGSTITFGGTFSRPRFLSRDDLFTIGATFTTPANLIGERTELYRNSSLNDTIENPNSIVSLPTSFALGASYRKNRLTIGADVSFQNWSAQQYFNDDVSYRRNSFRVGLGGELSGSNERRANFFSKLTYRTGLFFHQTPLQFAGNGIDELGITAGLGIPISGDFSILDINLEFASRGTTDFNLIKENIFRLRISLNAGELWFQKRKIE